MPLAECAIVCREIRCFSSQFRKCQILAVTESRSGGECTPLRSGSVRVSRCHAVYARDDVTGECSLLHVVRCRRHVGWPPLSQCQEFSWHKRECAIRRASANCAKCLPVTSCTYHTQMILTLTEILLYLCNSLCSSLYTLCSIMWG